MNYVAQIITKIQESIPVKWDRFTVNDDDYYVVYGWIARSDGDRDFLVVSMENYDSGNVFDVFYTTSSAKYSKQLCMILYGEDEGHSDCIKIEELFLQ